MHRTEAQFCREEAKRLLELAAECSDQKVRQHLLVMANAWVERAKLKEGSAEKKSA
jgi:hypothetical protein